jgi:N-acetyl-gamma-glutamyl-phosphate reductase
MYNYKLLRFDLLEDIMLKVSILGATGYVGIEIVRLLCQRNDIELVYLTSTSFAGKKISEIYPNLKGICDIELVDIDIENIAKNSDIAITALPHGVSKEIIPKLFEKNVKVLDHSGDFRYRDYKVYEKWYNTTHGMESLLKYSVYGLPELYRDKIPGAKIIANPGCYPTSIILALAPLIKNDIVKANSIIINSASGITGAGRKETLQNMFSEHSQNYKAYNISTHRHTSEIEQEISLIAGNDIMVSFTPHILPVKRGILSTIHVDLKKNADKDIIRKYYTDFYKNEFFVRITEDGVLPELKNVVGSNFIDIGFVIDERLGRIIIVSALDNLLKGAAGQAVQILNILNKCPENTGLISPGLYL